MFAGYKNLKIHIGLFLLLFLQFQWGLGMQPVRVFGNILHDEIEEISISYKEHPLAEMEIIKVRLDRQGNFQLKLSIDQARPCFLRYGREQSLIYLFPGDRIDLIADAESFDETLVFTGYGQGVVASRFLAAYFLKFEDKLLRREASARIKQASPRAYLDYKLAQREDKLRFLDQAPDLPREFVRYMRKRIDYVWGKDLLEYPVKHAYLNELPYERVPVAPRYYSFLNDLRIQDDEAWHLREYQDFLDAFFAYEYSKVNNSVEAGQRFAYLYDTAPDYLVGMPLQIFRARSLLNATQYLNPGDVISRYMYFVESEEGRNLRPYLEAAYRNILALAPGNPAPDFALEDQDGKLVRLSDFAGKIVYLHFWASWCDPRKDQLPHLNKLAYKFQDEEVVILNISLDEFPKVWHRKIMETNLAGIQLWAKGLWSDMPMSYGIRNLPAFMIISKEGIISESPAFPPSHMEVVSQILRNHR